MSFSLAMRSITLRAIVAPLFSLIPASVFCLPVWAVPAAGDVVVEIKLIPSEASSPSARKSPEPVSAVSSATFPSFNSEQLDRQLQRYLSFVEQNGVPDVLVVGSSRALQGVNPLVLQQSLEQHGYPRLKVFNFGVNGATAQVVNWLLWNVLSPSQLPRLIVWADGSRAFNSGRTDHTFNKIVVSKGHRQLLAGTRPAAKLPTGVKLGQVCMDLLPVPLPLSERSLPVVASARSSTPTCKQPFKLVVQKNLPSSTQGSENELEALGFQVVNSVFQPSQYFQRYPRVSGRFDADYRNFFVGGTQANALENVLRFTSAYKVPLVIVNLPLTATYLDDARNSYEAEFRSQMQRLARSQRFTFVDLSSSRSLAQNAYFADPSHLNQLGAIAVAQEIGKALARLRPSLISLQQTDPLESKRLDRSSHSLLTVRIISSLPQPL